MEMWLHVAHDNPRVLRKAKAFATNALEFKRGSDDTALKFKWKGFFNIYSTNYQEIEFSCLINQLIVLPKVWWGYFLLVELIVDPLIGRSTMSMQYNLWGRQFDCKVWAQKWHEYLFFIIAENAAASVVECAQCTGKTRWSCGTGLDHVVLYNRDPDWAH